MSVYLANYRTEYWLHTGGFQCLTTQEIKVIITMMGCFWVNCLEQSSISLMHLTKIRDLGQTWTHQMDPGWGLWNLQNKKHVIFKTIKGMKDGRTVADERKRTRCVTFRKCEPTDSGPKMKNETFCSKLGNLKGFYGLAVLCLCGREF